LVEALWQGAPPGSARAQIQVEISALRALIRGAGGGDPISTSAAGYRIEEDPGALDLDEFTARVAQAPTAGSRGERAAAADGVRGGIKVGGGRALGDVAGGYVEAARLHLEDLRVTALEQLADVELRRNRHGEIVGWLDELVSEHPLRESLTCHVMLALYRSG